MVLNLESWLTNFEHVVVQPLINTCLFGARRS